MNYAFDADYLRALRERDASAENYLVSSFSRPVQLKLRARLRSPELVQDASQETFLRVLTYFRSGKTLDNPASLPAFVHTVCHNIALEFLRAHTHDDQLPENAPEPADSSLNPESQLATAERKELVRRLIAELPIKDQQLLRRVFLDEEDRDLVCREFHVDRGYLRVLLHRARLRFKAVLSQEAGHAERDAAARSEKPTGRASQMGG
ncbi:MAG TPA: sigma-70 family RNA polymerase sigma factor [Bryobacteraceae bacterium]|nr:sigma-70 family RNA polymerase sigma factor [Bryobacteraceae bacterium]